MHILLKCESKFNENVQIYSKDLVINEIDDNCVWKDATLFYIINVFPALYKYVRNVI